MNCEDIEKLPQPEVLKLAKQLRAMYVESVLATEQQLNPAALRNLDAAIAEGERIAKM